MLRVLSFLQHRETDHPWAHPLDGLVAYVDLIERRVLHLVDHELLPVPEEEGNFDDPAAVGPARTSLEPIQITRPEGPSFTPRRRRGHLGGMAAADRLRRPRGADPASALALGPAGPLPRLHRRDDGPPRPAGRLPHAGLRLPGRDPPPGRGPARRGRRAPPDAQRHLPARGGRRGRLEAQRPVHRLLRDPPHAAPGHLDLRRHRQLRPRVLLVPVPRRPDRAGDQGWSWSACRPGPTTRTATPSPGGSRGCGASPTGCGPPTPRSAAPGRWSTRPGPTGSASRSPTPSTPQPAPLLAAGAGAAVTSRAAFATRHLWVTRYDRAQRYAAGDLPNQHPGRRPDHGGVAAGPVVARPRPPLSSSTCTGRA
jgi:hypothetical protein